MIPIKDPRIGDLVKTTTRNPILEKGSICKVVLIDALINSIIVQKSDVDVCRCLVKEEIEGIPLTPDIFNKNDFTEEVVGEYYTKPLDNETHPFKRYLSVERKSDNWAVFIKYRRLYDNALLRKIQHVHELQHILWALGLDANLKI